MREKENSYLLRNCYVPGTGLCGAGTKYYISQRKWKLREGHLQVSTHLVLELYLAARWAPKG